MEGIHVIYHKHYQVLSVCELSRSMYCVCDIHRYTEHTQEGKHTTPQSSARPCTPHLIILFHCHAAELCQVAAMEEE